MARQQGVYPISANTEANALPSGAGTGAGSGVGGSDRIPTSRSISAPGPVTQPPGSLLNQVCNIHPIEPPHGSFRKIKCAIVEGKQQRSLGAPGDLRSHYWASKPVSSVRMKQHNRHTHTHTKRLTQCLAHSKRSKNVRHYY